MLNRSTVLGVHARSPPQKAGLLSDHRRLTESQDHHVSMRMLGFSHLRVLYLLQIKNIPRPFMYSLLGPGVEYLHEDSKWNQVDPVVRLISSRSDVSTITVNNPTILRAVHLHWLADLMIEFNRTVKQISILNH